MMKPLPITLQLRMTPPLKQPKVSSLIGFLRIKKQELMRNGYQKICFLGLEKDNILSNG